MPRAYVTYENCEVVATTEKAVRFELEDGSEWWIPRSQIGKDPDDDEDRFFTTGEEGVTIEVAEWFVKKEEMPY